jgi:hypothetical protein
MNQIISVYIRLIRIILAFLFLGKEKTAEKYLYLACSVPQKGYLYGRRMTVWKIVETKDARCVEKRLWGGRTRYIAVTAAGALQVTADRSR